MDREYKYEMGFAINDVLIPDPSSFSGASSDLDTLGTRSTTGELHRNKVATKHHMKLSWNGLEWDMIRYIGDLLAQGDRFRFTYVDALDGLQTIVAYCGDREWEALFCADTYDSKWLGTLSVSVIEI